MRSRVCKPLAPFRTSVAAGLAARALSSPSVRFIPSPDATLLPSACLPPSPNTAPHPAKSCVDAETIVPILFPLCLYDYTLLTLQPPRPREVTRTLRIHTVLDTHRSLGVHLTTSNNRDAFCSFNGWTTEFFFNRTFTTWFALSASFHTDLTTFGHDLTC